MFWSAILNFYVQLSIKITHFRTHCIKSIIKDQKREVKDEEVAVNQKTWKDSKGYV